VNKEITLVLGGTGVKGIANIGVFEALSARNIKIKKIYAAGTSAPVAVQYALGKQPDELTQSLVDFFINNHKYLWGLEQMSGLFQIRKRRIINSLDYFLRERLYCEANLRRISVLSWKLINPLLLKLFGNKTFADLKIPVAFSTIDLNISQFFLVDSGRLTTAIKASIAYPGLFPPVVVNGREMESSTPYCDLPLQAINKEDAPVLAIDFPVVEHPHPETLLEIITRVSEVRNQAIKTRLLKQADYVIRLETMNQFRWGNYRKIPIMIKRAREEMLAKLLLLDDV
jgi:NTE family protein